MSGKGKYTFFRKTIETLMPKVFVKAIISEIPFGGWNEDRATFKENKTGLVGVKNEHF